MARWYFDAGKYFQELTEIEIKTLEENALEGNYEFSYNYENPQNGEVTPYKFNLMHMTQTNKNTGTVRRLLQLGNDRSHMVLSPFHEKTVENAVQQVLGQFPVSQPGESGM